VDADLVLVEAVKKGNTQAFRKLVQRHQDFAYTLAYRILKDRQEAEEAAQDAFVKVFRSISAYEGNGKFTTWLYTIVYRECLNRLRKNKTYVEDIDEVREGSAHHSAEDTGLEAMEKDERRAMIQTALNQLNPKESAALTLFYLEEQSLKEVSTVTGMTVSNIKVILHRGRKNLLKVLSTMNSEPIKSWI
jgi:RNA polymerase sigma factor (sigma-70 family)